jgi:hypothetical protein
MVLSNRTHEKKYCPAHALDFPVPRILHWVVDSAQQVVPKSTAIALSNESNGKSVYNGSAGHSQWHDNGCVAAANPACFLKLIF